MKKLSSALALLLSCYGEAWADPSVNVPLNHWGYGFVERFEARGVLHGIGDGIKPLSRGEMARMGAAVEEAAKQGLALSAVDRRQMDHLLAEMGGEGRPGGYNYQGPQGQFWVDGLFRQQSDLFSGRGRRERELVFRNQVGGVVQGDFIERVGFRLSFSQTREQGSRRYYLRDDVYERRLELPQLKGRVTDYHEGRAYVTFSWGWLDLEAGKDELSWGPAPVDNLGLSNNAPSFDLIRLRAKYSAFKLVSVTGFLRPCPDRPDSPLCGGDGNLDASYIVNHTARTLEREKHLAAHRLEVAVAPWLDLGFQEMVIYGDRGLEAAYLNPLMFYWAAQSYLGDKDNVLMGLDADFHPGGGVRAYFAYVVDDLKKARMFSSDFANKFSFQAGGLYVNPLGLADTELRAEYTRIEPWIYTHKFPINTYRHFDAPLGHSLGPNSDRWQFQASRRFPAGLEASLGLSRTRHGDNLLQEDGTILNVGGDLHLGWRPGDANQSKTFLAGQVSRRTLLEGELRWRGQGRLEVSAGYGYERGEGVPLPPRWGSGVALRNRTGYGQGGQRHLSFDLRYGWR
ncbi:MAG: hypothetical protein FJY95_06525 [Candidatus Handelsmanbacteria bacterium]|nr:hypothetical protein [Candidatus Handelsmanbacteria bacterium]